MLIVSAWTFQGLTLLNGLIAKTKNPSGSIIGVIVFIWFFSGFLVSGGTYSINLVEGERRLSFYGVSLPWLPVVLLYQMPILFFIFLSARRKMESARMHPLSKPQAIAAMITFAALVLGGIWKQENPEILQTVALYLLVVPAILLTLMVTPSQAEYCKGLRRAQKQGRTHLPWWDDLSVSWVFLAITAAMVLAAGTIAWSAAAGPPDAFASTRPSGSFPLALATGVLVVVYFGLALQYFLLRFAGRGRMYFGLCLFLAWLLPLLAGSIQALATAWRPPPADEPGYILFSVSPLAGIALTAAVGDDRYSTAIQAAAITPALLFTFVFNSLLISARRRVLESVYLMSAGPKVLEDASAPVGSVEDRAIDEL
jgi:hypothetical protein